MIIEAYEDKHQIKQLEKFKNEIGIGLKWKYKDASHFMIIIFDARKGLDMEYVVEDMDKKSITPENLIKTNPRMPFYSNDDGIMKAFVIGEAEFLNKERNAIIPSNFFKKGVPYGIAIFACEYDKEYRELSLYLPCEEENQVYMPVKVQSEVTYKKCLIGKTKQCILHVQRLDGYKEGAITYHVDGVTGDFPLSSGCLGKDIVITVPKEADVTVRIADEDKKYYEKA